jgi:hypothetical protein
VPEAERPNGREARAEERCKRDAAVMQIVNCCSFANIHHIRLRQDGEGDLLSFL